MKLAHTEKTSRTTQTTSRPWRAILIALAWIGAGVVALLTLCLVGPAIVVYTTSAGLPIVVLALLVSSLIAGWDVGGLLLIMIGIRQLMITWSLRHER
jgi:hypothetical protein